ncbi:hypothetical protein FNF28_03100 [Cafeteria roenbergensis]|uniref:Uncharacterized protein n=2 Tax=Cafeteria roenbergensis TaxID=33653 RepID=A0A5A8DMS9_CAFRO|nr:hypothetical protein FNF28_03100 [Cafeteria roenbergensis]
MASIQSPVSPGSQRHGKHAARIVGRQSRRSSLPLTGKGMWAGEALRSGHVGAGGAADAHASVPEAHLSSAPLAGTPPRVGRDLGLSTPASAGGNGPMFGSDWQADAVGSPKAHSSQAGPASSVRSHGRSSAAPGAGRSQQLAGGPSLGGEANRLIAETIQRKRDALTQRRLRKLQREEEERRRRLTISRHLKRKAEEADEKERDAVRAEVARSQREAAKERRFVGLLESLEAGSAICQRLETKTLGRHDKGKRRQLEQMHRRWQEEVGDKVEGALVSHVEKVPVRQRRMERVAQSDAYNREAEQGAVFVGSKPGGKTGYDPFRFSQGPVVLPGGVRDPTKTSLMRGATEAKQTLDSRLPAAAAEALGLLAAAIRKAVEESGTGRQLSEAEARDIAVALQRSRAAGKAEGKWTLPPSTWGSGFIEDMPFVRNWPLPGDSRRRTSAAARGRGPTLGRKHEVVLEAVEAGEAAAARQRERVLPSWFEAEARDNAEAGPSSQREFGRGGRRHMLAPGAAKRTKADLLPVDPSAVMPSRSGLGAAAYHGAGLVVVERAGGMPAE